MSVPIHELDGWYELAVDVANRDAEPDLLTEAIKRPLASADPDVIAYYERLVVAREGSRRFCRATTEDGPVEWLAKALKADDLLARAQRVIEGLR